MAIRFGLCPPIFAAPGNPHFRTPNFPTLDPLATVDMARAADALGYDSLWVADHLMLGRDEAILEGWTTLSVLAGATQQIRLGLIHQSNLLRHPALAAKMAATLDQLSQGRLIHFFDLGNNAREHRAYGLPWTDDAEERAARMEEALQLTLELWTAAGPISRKGRFYQLEEAVCRPQPAQKPHPPIWIGEARPALLDLCARYAQGWNSVPVSLSELERRLQALAAACQRVGRPYEDLEKSFETQILLAPDRQALRQRLREMAALNPALKPDGDLRAYLQSDTGQIPPSLADSFLIGTPGEVEQQIRARIEVGISHFLLWFMDAPRREGLELFAGEVMPRFR